MLICALGRFEVKKVYTLFSKIAVIISAKKNRHLPKADYSKNWQLLNYGICALCESAASLFPLPNQSRVCISFYLFCKLMPVGKACFIAKAFNELNFQFLTIDTLWKVKNVRFYSSRFSCYCRVPADICNPCIGTCVMKHIRYINTLFWKQLVRGWF